MNLEPFWSKASCRLVYHGNIVEHVGAAAAPEAFVIAFSITTLTDETKCFKPMFSKFLKFLALAIAKKLKKNK